jgi:hypothetical protein
MELMIQAHILPFIRDECPINALQRWMSSFITSGEQPAIEVNLLERCCVDESPELSHEPPIHSDHCSYPPLGTPC